MIASELTSKVRQSDYGRYCASILLPNPLRSASLSLLAFHQEIATIPRKTQEPLAGAMRLTWWRERIEDIYAGKPPRQHPVLLGLAQSISDYPLPMEHFINLITAYSKQLEIQEFDDMASIQSFAGETHAPMLKLHESLLDTQISEINTFASICGMTDILTHMPQKLARGEIWIPKEIMEQDNQESMITALQIMAKVTLDSLESIKNQFKENNIPRFFKHYYVLNAWQLKRMTQKPDLFLTNQLSMPPPFLLLRLIMSRKMR